MSTSSATRITTSAAAAHDYDAGAQQPPLAVIDAAIMQAVAAGDSARRDALMATRAAIEIGKILANLPGAMPAGPVPFDQTDPTDPTDA